MNKKEQNAKRYSLFLEIWDERRKWDEEEKEWYVPCFETGVPLWESKYKTNKSCYSHILSKKKYPQYDLLKNNIEIVHPNEHYLFELNEDNTPNQKERKSQLLLLHTKNELGV